MEKGVDTVSGAAHRSWHTPWQPRHMKKALLSPLHGPWRRFCREMSKASAWPQDLVSGPNGPAFLTLILAVGVAGARETTFDSHRA